MRALLVIALLAGCNETNHNYCPDHPDNNCNIDADVNAPQDCVTSANCTNGAKPVCEPSQHVCVACTADTIGACSGLNPVCSADNVCTPCTTHGQCTSDVCLPTGACAAEAEVAYVAPTGDDLGGCTKTSPCKTIGSALLLSRTNIKLQGNVDEAVLVANGTFSFFAEAGTTLRRTQSQGPIFEARGSGTTVAIYDLIIRDATGTTGTGVYVAPGESAEITLARVHVLNNGANGINMQGGKLTMTRSVVSGNVAGGAIISGVFNITNSLFVANGSGTSTTGGLTLTPQNASTTFKFNTVADNLSSSGSASVRGMNCTLPMTASNTIVAGNLAATGCSFQYSLFDTGTAMDTNVVGDPMFKNVDALDPTAADYFHIQPNSAAVDRADPVSTMATDIDGQPRPQGNAPDIGADELN